MESKLLILGLHRVGLPPRNAKIRGLFISPDVLIAQLNLLNALGFRFMTLRDALADRKGSRAVVTFDDGYADNYSAAFPILESLGIPATLFVITSDVGRKSVVWDEAGEDLPSDMITWDELRRLHKHGWEIGSHCHNHVHLDRYGEDDQTAMIWRSIDIMQKELGETPTSFAYPYGKFNESTKSILKQLGIRNAVTTTAGLADDDPAGDMLELGRVPLGGRYFYHFLKNSNRIVKAVGSIEFIKAAGNYLVGEGLPASRSATLLTFSQTNK